MKLGSLVPNVIRFVATGWEEGRCRASRRVEYLARRRNTKGSAAVGRDKDDVGSAQECGGASQENQPW